MATAKDKPIANGSPVAKITDKKIKVPINSVISFLIIYII